MERFISLQSGVNLYIREAFVEDAERLHDFYKRVTAQTEFLITTPDEVFDVATEKQMIRIYRSQHNRLYLVAFVSSDLVGTLKIAGNRRKRTCHVAELSIAVDKEWRGLGIGSALMEEGLEWARKHGIERIELTVVDSNVRAMRLYEKFGFTVEGIKKKAVKLSDGYHDVYIMARLL